MLRFLIRRLLLGVLTLWLVSTSVFVLAYWVPNDPARAIAGQRATQATVNAIRKALGMDDPLIVQYGRYMGELVKFNLGKSYVNGGTSVWTLISGSLPTTVWLVFGAGIIWLLFGIFTGVLSATKARSLFDRAATVFVLVGISVPPAVLGLTLTYALFFKARTNGIAIFDTGPPGAFFHDPALFLSRMVLPWVALAYLMTASYTRLTRSSMLEVLGEDYIRTARSKGMSERRVIGVHALRAALTPVVTLFGLDIGTLLGGVIITEKLFGITGLGWTIVNAINLQDLPVIMGIAVMAAVFVVTANLIVDIMYAVLDPRVRLN